MRSFTGIAPVLFAVAAASAEEALEDPSLPNAIGNAGIENTAGTARGATS